MKSPLLSRWSWWQAFCLSYDNCLRRHYRHQHHGWDPSVSLGLIAGSLVTFLGCLTVTIQERILFATQFFLWQEITFLLIPISLLIFMGACFSYDNYVQHIKKVSYNMYRHIPDLENFPEAAVRESARSRLIYLAKTLQEIEQHNPPYFREVVSAKADFERAYKIFLEAGLIQDVGYGEFFRA